MSQKKGFTLVELLVVISIIALLLSIMMPALSKVREQANSAVCRANLKQIVLGALLWSADHDDWSLPITWTRPSIFDDPFNPNSHTSNPGSLEPYLKASYMKGRDVLACPSAKHLKDFIRSGLDLYAGQDMEGDTLSKRCTYSINGYTACYQTHNNRPKSPGTLPIKGPVLDWAGPIEERPGWGIYNYKHGSTKVMNIRRPGETLYFIDQAYSTSSCDNLNPFIPKERLGGGFWENESRWHEKKRKDYGYGETNYGYGNIGWIDGHAGKEPGDFADPAGQGGPGENPRYWYYYWDH